MKNNKTILITIIVLLCVFVPLTIISFLNRQNIGLLEENPNHDTYYDGYIYFYNKNDEFLSKYECLTKTCEYTNTIIDDDNYGINYYKDGKIKNVSLINEKYTFITDGSVVNLYSVTNGNTLQTYKAVKTYNTNLENNSYIVQDKNDVWGVLSIGETLSSILPFEYSFIGLKSMMNDDETLSTDKFIVQKDMKWYIVDNTNSALSGYIDDPIIDYNEQYVFSKNLDRVKIFSYDNHEYLSEYNIKDYIIEDKYIGIITDTFLLVYENLDSKYIKAVAITDDISEIDLEKIDNKLNIKIDNEITESIELS